MADPFETVAFLATSENRVRLLEAVVEAPRTRAALHEETGIARATLGRILSDLQDRDWIQQDGPHYEATPQGRHLVTEFGALLDTVAALADLEEIVQWFPVDKTSFDLGRLRDARVTRPTSTDSIAPVRRARTLMQEANDILGLTSVFAPEALRGNHEAVKQGNQQFEVVFTSSVIDVVAAEEETRRLMRELIDTEGVATYRYDEDLSYPYNIWIIDGEAVIGVSDEEGAPKALIETDDRAVREWVRRTIESHRVEATSLTAADIHQ